MRALVSPELVNGVFGDPVLYLDFRDQKRALLAVHADAQRDRVEGTPLAEGGAPAVELGGGGEGEALRVAPPAQALGGRGRDHGAGMVPCRRCGPLIEIKGAAWRLQV